MLKEIRIENYKSISKEQLFSMEAAPSKEVGEYPNHIIEINNNRLLKVSSFYGPNGGGKTNLISSILLLRFVSLGSPMPSDSPDEKSYLSSVFNASSDISINVVFVTSKYELGYKFVVDMENTYIPVAPDVINRINFPLVPRLKPIIKYEEMSYKLINSDNYIECFKRDSNGLVTSSSLNGIDIIKNNLRLNPTQSFINYINSTFNNVISPNSSFNAVLELGNEIASIIPINYRDVSNYITFAENDIKVINKYIPKIVENISTLDIRIKNLVLRKNKNKDRYYHMYVIRMAKDGAETELPLSLESAGTIKLISCLLDIYCNMDIRKSCIYLGDDLDAHLHPKMMRCLINLFNAKENKNAQLIFNSHDMYNLSNKVFRRDEIWFADRDKDYATIFVPLTNIRNHKGEQVRKDAVFSKQYLEGRYGADPFINECLKWEKKNDF